MPTRTKGKPRPATNSGALYKREADAIDAMAFALVEMFFASGATAHFLGDPDFESALEAAEADARDELEERAAIRQFDAGYDRCTAEQLSLNRNSIGEMQLAS